MVARWHGCKLTPFSRNHRMTLPPAVPSTAGQRFRAEFRRLFGEARRVLTFGVVAGFLFSVAWVVFDADVRKNGIGGVLLWVTFIPAVIAVFPLGFIFVGALFAMIPDIAPSDPKTWGPRRRWIEENVTEDRVWAVILAVSGPVCLALIAASFFGHTPAFLDAKRWYMPAVTSYGLLWLAVVLAFAEFGIYAFSVGGNEPTTSLSAGQFLLAYTGLLLVGALAALSFAGLWAAVQVLADSLDANRYPVWHGTLPWVGGISGGLGLLYAVLLVPGGTLIQWLGQRRELDKLKTDALLTLAQAASDAAKSRPSNR